MHPSYRGRHVRCSRSSSLGDRVFDVPSSILSLGGVPVMLTAEEPHVVGLRVAAFGSRVAMIVLEPCPRAAAHAVLIDPTAGQAVALDHAAAGGARDVRGGSF